MNLYLVSQTEENGWDTYDAFVCAALSEEEAQNQLPSECSNWDKSNYRSWCSSPNKATVIFIGTAKEGTEAGLVLASFNAG